MKNFTPSSDDIRFAIIDDLLSAKPKGKLGKCPAGPPVVEKKHRWCDRYNKYREQYTDMVADRGDRETFAGWGYTLEQLHNLGFDSSRDAVEFHSDRVRRTKDKRSSWKALQRRENRLDERVWNPLRAARKKGLLPGIFEVSVRWDTYGYIPAKCKAEAEQLAHALLVVPLALDTSRLNINWVNFATPEKLGPLQAGISDMSTFDRQIRKLKERAAKEIAALEERREKVGLALAMTMGLLDIEEDEG